MSTIGVDFGGTRIKAGVVENGRVTELRVVPTPADLRLGGALDSLETMFRGLAAGAETSVDALVWALPTVVAGDGRTISKVFGKFDDCVDLPLADWARQRLGLPLILDNDARAAAIGEWRHGAGRGTENVVMITLGTGIGTAVIADGRPLYGAGGYAGNLGGHLHVPASERPCVCGGRGCIEAEVATWALPGIATKSPLFSASALAHADKIDYLAVFTLAESGDPLAVELRDRAISCWALMIQEMAMLYDPEVTVIGGGIMAGADSILPRLEATLGGRLRVAPAELGDAAALAGCGEIARLRLL